MPTDVPMLDDLSRGASFDLAQRYRYDLWRRWGPGPSMGWLMLNPSTADALVDDHTIRQCMKFARREGFDGIVVRNLFALRTAYPAVLFAHDEAERVGPDNDEWITRLRVDVELIVVAWGADRRAWPRIEYVESELLSGEVHCLAITKDGQPGHPARLPDAAPLHVYADYRARGTRT